MTDPSSRSPDCSTALRGEGSERPAGRGIASSSRPRSTKPGARSVAIPSGCYQARAHVAVKHGRGVPSPTARLSSGHGNMLATNNARAELWANPQDAPHARWKDQQPPAPGRNKRKERLAEGCHHLPECISARVPPVGVTADVGSESRSFPRKDSSMHGLMRMTCSALCLIPGADREWTRP